MKKSRGMIKLLSGAALLSTILSAGAMLSSEKAMFAANEPEISVLSTASIVQSVTIESTVIELPSTIWVVDATQTNHQDAGDQSPVEYGNVTYSNIREYDLIDEASLSVFDNLTYSLSVNTILEDENDDYSPRDHQYSYTNVILLSEPVDNKTHLIDHVDFPHSGSTYNVVFNENEDYAPVLSTTLSQTGVVANVSNPPTSESLLATFTAVDTVDGDVDVYYKDDTGVNYDNNRFNVGTYTLTVGAIDSAGNESTYSFPVIIKDVDAPEILGPDTYTSNMSSPITEAIIRGDQSVSDNYDELVDLTLKNDGFTGNEQTIGTYTIVYSAIDSSGNPAADKIVTVIVNDDIAPQINVTNREITVSASKYLSWNETIEGVTASDNVDGDLTSAITLKEDNYEANRYVLGTYTRVIQVTDAAGNTAEETITIHVVDLEAPVIYVKNQLLVDGLILTEDQLASIIADLNSISYMSYNFKNNEYTGNEETAGTYATTIAYTLEDGNQVEVETNVIVNDDSEQSTVLPNIEEKVEWYESDEVKQAAIYAGIGLVGLIAIIVAFNLGKKDKKGGKRK